MGLNKILVWEQNLVQKQRLESEALGRKQILGWEQVLGLEKVLVWEQNLVQKVRSKFWVESNF